jgi:hypothetical protein
MPDALTQLRESDPATHARRMPPPRDVLDRIVATPPEPPRPPRRRAPRLVMGATALAAAAVVAFAALPGADHAPGPIRASLAERAFAATAPQPDFITYAQTTTVQSGVKSMESRDVTRQWQYRDRMHNFMRVEQPRGTWIYEHDQNGDTFRTLADGKVDVTRLEDAGWDRQELEDGLKVGVTTLLQKFRSEIRNATDLGPSTFNGKAAHAYRVPEGTGRRATPGATTYYVDPETALPLGSTVTFGVHEVKVGKDGRPAEGKRNGTVTITTTVDRYEHLEPTPENLALLDAPNIDAAPKLK